MQRNGPKVAIRPTFSWYSELQKQADWLPHLADYEGVSTVFDITSFALALLLVFRTNACYSRCALLELPMSPSA